MILKNVYFREINIPGGTWEEFKNELGSALDILSNATEDSYERMNIAAFTDWATDLHWIKEENIIIKVNGPVTKIVEEVMSDIVNFWANDAKKYIAGGRNRNFEFILVDVK